MKGVLSKIKPLHPPLIPPEGAVPQNIVVRSGQQLYRQLRRMAKSVPLFRPNKEGVEERVYAKNPMTAEPLYPKRKHKMYDEELLYTLESQGNGNVEKVPYTFPTAEEIAAEEREKKIKEMGGGALGIAAVDMGLTADEIISRLMGPGVAPVPVESGSAGTQQEEFPQPFINGSGNRVPNKWLLSDGSSMQGKKEEALEAEAALHETVPEV